MFGQLHFAAIGADFAFIRANRLDLPVPFLPIKPTR